MGVWVKAFANNKEEKFSLFPYLPQKHKFWLHDLGQISWLSHSIWFLFLNHRIPKVVKYSSTLINK